MQVVFCMPKDSIESYSQTKLVEGIVKNDNDVLKWIYKSSYPKVERFVLANNGNKEQAKDVFQEAFISFWTNIKQGKFDPANETALLGYLFQIAKNKWLDILRSSGFKKTVQIEPGYLDSLTAEKDLDKEQYFEKLEAGFAKLGENCRELLGRFYYQKESIEKLAAYFGWTHATVKNNKYRCLEKLRKGIENRD